MKKYIFTVVMILALYNGFSVKADNIPREATPICANEDSIILTENLIGSILYEVQGGLGYAEARAISNNIIFNAVVNNQTNGYGYGILSAIANNAIFEYRDMYLRPAFYIQAEEKVKIIIADLITEIENGTKDYDTARKEAYIKILQYVDPSFSLENMQGDFCYWDIPAVDSAYFNRARKLLQNAVSRHAQNIQ